MKSKMARFFLTAILLSLACGGSGQVAAMTPVKPQKGPLPQEKAYLGLEIFTRGCFSAAGEESKLLSYLDKEGFSPANPRGTFMEYALEATGVREGRLWGGDFARGRVAILLEKNGTCHTLVYDAQPEALHQGMKDFRALRKEDPDAEYVFIPHKIDDPAARDRSMVRIRNDRNTPVEITLITMDGAQMGLTGVITLSFPPEAGRSAAAP